MAPETTIILLIIGIFGAGATGYIIGMISGIIITKLQHIQE